MQKDMLQSRRSTRQSLRRAGRLMVAVVLVLAQFCFLAPAMQGASCPTGGEACSRSCQAGPHLTCCCCTPASDMQAADIPQPSTVVTTAAALPSSQAPLAPSAGFKPFVPPSGTAYRKVVALAEGSPLRGPPSVSPR